MKKSIFAAVAVALTAFSACSAKDTVTTDTTVLPEAASAILENNYNGVAVTQVKIDKDAFESDEYEVTLADGTYVEFTNEGKVAEVKAPNGKAVPDALVPATILEYVKANYPDQTIQKIDFGKNDTEVKLNNGVELEFDLQGNFLKID